MSLKSTLSESRTRHLYEGSFASKEGVYYGLGPNKSLALKRAGEFAREAKEKVTVFHTAPAPGPIREIVGHVLPGGTYVEEK